MDTDPHQRCLRTADAAAYCGSRKSTFEKLRITGVGPAFLKLGRRGRVGFRNGLMRGMGGSIPYFSSVG